MMMLMKLAAHPGPWNDEGPWNSGDAPAWWPVFPITFGLFWVAVLAAAFYLLRRRMTPPAPPSPPDPKVGARKLLAERFARGEIDEDEYYTRLSVLDNSA